MGIGVVGLSRQLQVWSGNVSCFSLGREPTLDKHVRYRIDQRKDAMSQLASLKILPVIAAVLALAACSNTSATTADYSSVSARADQAMATAQHALEVAQQAEADAKAANQQTSAAYQRSLQK